MELAHFDPRNQTKKTTMSETLATSTSAAATANELSNRRVWIMMPAYNEQAAIESLVGKICRTSEAAGLNYEIVVVDDASTDDTARIASQLSFHHPLTLEQHQQNQGLAGAMRTGFQSVLQRGKSGDIVVTLDADDTQPPELIPAMLQGIDAGRDVVIASRYQPGSQTIGVPRNRLAMTWMAKWMFKTITPISGVWDYTCGFRAYRFDALKSTADYYGDSFISETGFSCMVDILLKMRRFDFRMGEVPMVLRYDQKEGPSKMNVGRTATQTLRLLVRRRLGY